MSEAIDKILDRLDFIEERISWLDRWRASEHDHQKAIIEIKEKANTNQNAHNVKMREMLDVMRKSNADAKKSVEKISKRFRKSLTKD